MKSCGRFLLALVLSASSIGITLSLDSYEAADQLADVLVSEDLCGLSFNQDAIAAWIEANVAADDMEFSGNLSSHISLSEYTLKDISTSAKTAHCAQIRRVAKNYGFIE
jgi:hypothetical protein